MSLHSEANHSVSLTLLKVNQSTNLSTKSSDSQLTNMSCQNNHVCKGDVNPLHLCNQHIRKQYPNQKPYVKLAVGFTQNDRPNQQLSLKIIQIFVSDIKWQS